MTSIRRPLIEALETTQRQARRLSKTTRSKAPARLPGYDALFTDEAQVIESARRAAARSVNTVMTATYWLVGRRIVEAEQAGTPRAGYGEMIVGRLAVDLTSRFGRGFGRRNLFQIRAFYLAYREIAQTPSALFESDGSTEIVQTPSALLGGTTAGPLASKLRLPWSHYVRLLAVKSEHARAFYEDEAIRGGWTVLQLDRQIQSQFYERTALSKNKAAMLRKGALAKPEDTVTPEEEIKEPYLLEFLDLKHEYSETELEAALRCSPPSTAPRCRRSGCSSRRSRRPNVSSRREGGPSARARASRERNLL